MALEPARIINHYLIKQTEIPYLRKTFSVNKHNNICKKSKLNNILLNHVFSHVHPLKKKKKKKPRIQFYMLPNFGLENFSFLRGFSDKLFTYV